MLTELELALLFDEFVNDLNRNITPKIYELMKDKPELLEQLMPMLNFATWVKVETTEIPHTIEERVKTNVMAEVFPSTTT